MDDNNEPSLKVQLTLKVGRFVDDEGHEGAEFKMNCQVDDGPKKALFEVIADATMLEYHELFKEHLGNLAEALIHRNLQDATEEAAKQEAAQERVRLETEVLH